MNILCTICVRGGSTNLKNKNIKKINNYGKKILDTTIKEITKFL